MPLSISQFLLFVAALPESTHRTEALEQRLEIGTGFHGKWYRSQRDHWLGWLVVQECQALSRGQDPNAALARSVWQRLNCSPMMFWLADAAALHEDALDQAELAAMAAKVINPKDGAPHGTMIRRHLRWELVEQAIILGRPLDDSDARKMAVEAFGRLTAKNTSYRHLSVFLPPPQGDKTA